MDRLVLVMDKCSGRVRGWVWGRPYGSMCIDPTLLTTSPFLFLLET